MHMLIMSAVNNTYPTILENLADTIYIIDILMSDLKTYIYS